MGSKGPGKWMFEPVPRGRMKYPFRGGKFPQDKEEARRAKPEIRRWALQVVDKLLENERYHERLPMKRLVKGTGFSKMTLEKIALARKKVLGIGTKARPGGPRPYPSRITRMIEEAHGKAALRGAMVDVKALSMEIAAKTGFLVSPDSVTIKIRRLNERNARLKKPTAKPDVSGFGGEHTREALEKLLQEAGIRYVLLRAYRYSA